MSNYRTLQSQVQIPLANINFILIMISCNTILFYERFDLGENTGTVKIVSEFRFDLYKFYVFIMNEKLPNIKHPGKILGLSYGVYVRGCVRNKMTYTIYHLCSPYIKHSVYHTYSFIHSVINNTAFMQHKRVFRNYTFLA